jgi:streptomycin 6-kinase
VFQELLADRAPSVLLHGDLHHDNTLADEARRWVVIDPKGFVGDRAYDATAMLYNPLPGFSEVSDPDPVLHRRLAILSHVLGVDRERLAAWGYVKAVLSMLWTLEDGGQLDGTDVRLRVIAALRRLI